MIIHIRRFAVHDFYLYYLYYLLLLLFIFFFLTVLKRAKMTTIVQNQNGTWDGVYGVSVRVWVRVVTEVVMMVMVKVVCSVCKR